MHDLLLKLVLRFVGQGAPGPIKRKIGSAMLRHLPGMLTCAEFEDFVHDYYDGLLSEKVRNQFQTHMKLCPMCRVHFDSYVRSVALGQRVCAEDERLPEGMPEELIGAILVARSQEGSR